MRGSYVTTYCNHTHRLSDGKPIGHQCHVLPPKALAAEREGRIDEAIELLRAAKSMRVHRGTHHLRGRSDMRLETFRAEMVELARKLIPTIADQDRASAGDDVPGMQVTVGADQDGWAYQTGDNSFTGGAYCYSNWAVTELYRDSQPEEFATEVISQLEDEMHEIEEHIFNEEHPAHE